MRFLRPAAFLAFLAVPACANDDAPAAPVGNAAGTGGSASGTGGAGGSSNVGGAAGSNTAAGASGSAGKPSSVVPALGCNVDADCTARIPATTPAGCARALCDVGQCVFATVDADGDGAPTRFCKSNDPAFVIKVGTDCDDANDDIHPGAWDGPAADGKPNHCGDGVDQDCSGLDGDTVAPNGQSCECIPGDTGACSADASGKPITFPSGSGGVKGECRQGSRTCLLDSQTGGGRWGACIGAVAPEVEECNGKDDDCDGTIDEEAIDRRTFTCDADADNHLAKDAATTIACFAPTEGCKGKWQETAPVDDCNDAQPLAYTGLNEQCDGLDNDCNGKVDETFACALGSAPVAATTCPGAPAAANVACKRYCDSICQQGDCFADVQVTGQATAAQQVAGVSCGGACPAETLAIIGPNKAGQPQPLAAWKIDLPPGKYRVVFDIVSSNTEANALGAMYAESKLPAATIGARANSWFNFRQIGGKFTIDLPIDACGQETLLSIASSVPDGGPNIIVKGVSWSCVEGACMTLPAK